MSVVDMPNLAPALQSLVDARLDAIDRMLLGQVSRQERLDVVGEVEGRIHELLRERLGAGGEPSRDDVLAVLARLDPPEAYLPEGAPSMEASAPPRAPRTAREVAPQASATDSVSFARLSLALGTIALATAFMIPLGFAVGLRFDSELVAFAFWVPALTCMLVCGLASVALALRSRLKNPGAIIGLVSGCVSLLLVFVMALWLATLFV